MSIMMKNLSELPEMASNKVKELDAAIEKVIAGINEEDISDIIFYDDEKSFYNFFTQKRSSILDEVIREGKRFLLFERRQNVSLPIKGLYVKEMMFDTLVFFSCKLSINVWEPDCGWEVDEVCATSKTMKISASKYAKAFSVKNCETIDMCGQARVVNSVFLNDLETPIIASTNFTHSNFIAGALETALHYYGGPMCIRRRCSNNPRLVPYRIYSDFNTIMEIFATDNDCGFQDNHTLIEESYMMIGPLARPNDFVLENTEMISKRNNIILPDLPDHVMQKMKDYSKRTLVENSAYILETTYKAETLMVLQKYEGDYVARCFMPVCHWVYPTKDTQVDMMEVEYIIIKDLQYVDNRVFSGTIVWREEDDRCTSLEGITRLADDFISCVDEIINMKPGEEIKFNEIFKKPIAKYFTSQTAVLKKLLCMKFSKQFMKILSICNTEERWETFWNNMNCFSAENWCFEKFYIEDYEYFNTQEKELHKMFNLPKGMFQYALDNHYSLVALGFLQKIFCGFNADIRSIKFFTNINKKDYAEMLEIYTKCEIPHYEIATCMAYLVRIFGHENWRGYLKHIEKANKEDKSYIHCYLDYLENLYDAFEAGHKDLVKKANWKNTNMESLRKDTEVMFCIKNESVYSYADKRIAKLQEKWKEYAFEDENYVVRWPEKPVDIVMEGMALNHCAKNFVFPVAMGSTEILFVRKKEKEDRPYFTLEIMNGEVRQFHGFDNSNIFSQPESLTKFLVKFCKEKKIVYNDGEALEEEIIKEKDMAYYREVCDDQEDLAEHYEISRMFENYSEITLL